MLYRNEKELAGRVLPHREDGVRRLSFDDAPTIVLRSIAGLKDDESVVSQGFIHLNETFLLGVPFDLRDLTLIGLGRAIVVELGGKLV